MSLVLGSWIAWVGGLLIAAAMHVASMQARTQWGLIWASQSRSGDKRAGSSDGTGTGGEYEGSA